MQFRTLLTITAKYNVNITYSTQLKYTILFFFSVFYHVYIWLNCTVQK